MPLENIISEYMKKTDYKIRKMRANIGDPCERGGSHRNVKRMY